MSKYSLRTGHIREAQPKEAVQTIASYRNRDESIVIQQYPNGLFYNHYGYDEQRRFAMAMAGGFASIEEAEAALRSHRPKAEKVMEEVHAELVPDAGAVQMPEDETPEDVREDAVPTPPETAENSAKEPAYQVGDTIYLEDTAFIVEEIGLFDVQLRDPTLAYPILRAESRERLERTLRADERNAHLFALEVSAEQDDPRGNSEYFPCPLFCGVLAVTRPPSLVLFPSDNASAVYGCYIFKMEYCTNI